MTLTERERQTDQNKIENEEESSSSNKMKTKMKILDFFSCKKGERVCSRVALQKHVSCSSFLQRDNFFLGNERCSSRTVIVQCLTRSLFCFVSIVTLRVKDIKVVGQWVMAVFFQPTANKNIVAFIIINHDALEWSVQTTH